MLYSEYVEQNKKSNMANHPHMMPATARPAGAPTPKIEGQLEPKFYGQKWISQTNYLRDKPEQLKQRKRMFNRYL